MDLDHASDGWFFHKFPSSIETPIAPNADFNPLIKTNNIYIGKCWTNFQKKGAMLQRSQIFFPLSTCGQLCVSRRWTIKKKKWCLDHQHFFDKKYINKITGHISYENPASKEHPRISPQTHKPPVIRLGPRLPRIETIAQSGIWCLGGRSQPPNWSASNLGRKWDRFKNDNLLFYFVTRQQNQQKMVSQSEQLRWFWWVFLSQKWTFTWTLTLDIRKFSTSTVLEDPKIPSHFGYFGKFLLKSKNYLFGEDYHIWDVSFARILFFKNVKDKSYDFPKSTAW